MPFHESLTPEQSARAKSVWDIIGGFDHAPSFEVFELNLCKEAHPDRELGAIEWVAEQFAEYRKANPHEGTYSLKRKLGRFYADSFKKWPAVVVKS
jgi:hypothetical protein